MHTALRGRCLPWLLCHLSGGFGDLILWGVRLFNFLITVIWLLLIGSVGWVGGDWSSAGTLFIVEKFGDEGWRYRFIFTALGRFDNRWHRLRHTRPDFIRDFICILVESRALLAFLTPDFEHAIVTTTSTFTCPFLHAWPCALGGVATGRRMQSFFHNHPWVGMASWLASFTNLLNQGLHSLTRIILGQGLRAMMLLNLVGEAFVFLIYSLSVGPIMLMVVGLKH